MYSHRFLSASPSFPIKSYLIWGLAALFYAYEFVLRVSPSIIVDNLILEFSAFELSKATLGSLSALYFYAYALTQIPAGILCDRFGVGRILTFACLLTTIGTFIFSSTYSIHIANMSRLVIGAGSAFAFVSCLKIAKTWIPPVQFPLIVGLTNAFGMLGAILGNQPLAQLVTVVGWREAFYILGLIGFILSIGLWLFVPNPPTSENINNQNLNNSSNIAFSRVLFFIIQDIIDTLTNKQTWLIAFYGCLIVAPIATFGELWGVSFLQTRFMIDKTIASGLIAWIFMGIGLGGPSIGLLATRFQAYKLIMGMATLLALSALLFILYYPTLSLLQTRGLLFIYGFLSSNMLLCFSLIGLQNKSSSHVAAIGFANMMIMGGSAAFQPLVGKLLDMGLFTQPNNNLALGLLPPLAVFQMALLVLPLCLVVAIGLTFFIQSPPKPVPVPVPV